jgi:chromosome segregation ATPase
VADHYHYADEVEGVNVHALQSQADGLREDLNAAQSHIRDLELQIEAGEALRRDQQAALARCDTARQVQAGAILALDNRITALTARLQSLEAAYGSGLPPF